MQIRLLSIFASVLLMLLCSYNSNVITVKSPVRPAGQESVLGLSANPIDTVRVGFIGLGMRGHDAVTRIRVIPQAKVAAICDIETARAERTAKYLADRGCTEAEVYSGEELAALQAGFEHPLMNPEFVETAKKIGGHGGMDFIMDYRLIYCLHHGLPLDMDVYDFAEWCCISDLSRISLENGSMPVEVPDFTRGEWNKVNGFRYSFR